LADLAADDSADRGAIDRRAGRRRQLTHNPVGNSIGREGGALHRHAAEGDQS
jgi:hypothetical protein